MFSIRWCRTAHEIPLLYHLPAFDDSSPGKYASPLRLTD
ncbi:hypothetical protein AWB80_07735 [Caballeronia pedi]|uniref:Uncharacterized protein n=1 Tax=Caballeronia pedi TaxID=1777141 RepID=A0A158DZ11_9BURK|nr:hypothetical protein AWB80_07735 [Caballeronia pedi]